MTLEAAQALKLTDSLYAELQTRSGDVERSENYFRGKQPLAYASDEWRGFHDQRFEKFADNWCGVVGGAPAERIRLNGVRLGADVAAQDDTEKDIMRGWHINDMDAQSSQGFLQSIIAKRSFVIGWFGPDGEPEYEWERPDQVVIGYEPGARMRRRAALKAWMDGDEEYATLYTPAEIWKFERKAVWAGKKTTTYTTDDGWTTTSGIVIPGEVGADFAGGWKPREVAGEMWPLPNPLGKVPVVEFPNRPILGAEPLSDIDGTIAMQDAINMLWAYLFAAADFASLPARVVMGQEPPKMPILDSNGQKIGEKPVEIEELKKGRLMYLTGQNTTIGQWEAAKLDTFTDVINIGVRHIAAQTRTPVHYIVGELSNVNGETLQAGESGLDNKVHEFHLFATPPARELFGLGELIKGNKATAEALRTATILWADTETRTLAQRSDAALKDRQVGLSLQTIFEQRYGMTPSEAKDELARVKDERAAGLEAVKPDPNQQVPA